MSGGGKRPIPKELRLLKNDKAHAHRYANKEEPEPSSELPEAPETLSEAAREIFDDFVERVSKMYPPSETDINMIVRYARLGERVKHYDYILRTEGDVYEGHVVDKNGEVHVSCVKVRPEVKMLKDCEDSQHKIELEFGLSPSSRCRINLKPQKKIEKENPFSSIKKKKLG